jgi:F0F1-type ATP synthase assembly protein I
MTDRRQPSGMSGIEEGWAVVSTLFAGIVVWGGIGWLIDLWLDTMFVKAIGVLVGLATAVYVIVVRFGRND